MKKFGKRTASVILALIMILQMMFVSGITAFADNETPIVPVDNPEVKINGINLILDGEIGLVYHVYVPDEFLNGYVVLSCKEDSVTTNIKDCTDMDMNLRYVFTWHLSAIELSEKVTITVYDQDDIKLASLSKSAEDYANLLLKDERATDTEKKIAETLINYGHYAQLACSEANGWVIGEDYAETTAFNAPTVDTSVFDDYEIEWQKHSETVNHLAMSLRLDYKTGIHLYFPLEEKPTVTVNGEAVEVTESERLENNYEIFIEGINALNLEDKYEITVNDATFTLSAFSYCKLAVQHNTSQNTIDAMRALFEFYQATVDYQTSKGA